VIFFDVDNTLLDYTTTSNLAALELLNHFKQELPYSAEEFLPMWHQVTEKHYADFQRGAISFIEQRRRRARAVFERAGMVLDDAEADRVIRVYLDAFEANTLLFPEILPVLDALKNQPKGIISNGEPSHQRHKIEQLGILNRFEVIAISDEVGAAKPDPAIFIWAARQAGDLPSKCIHVGDLLETDALGARAAGFRLGIWIDREKRPPAVAPLPEGVYKINQMSELLPLLFE